MPGEPTVMTRATTMPTVSDSIDAVELLRGRNPGRVALGDCSPKAPTDPDLPNSGIRLVMSSARYPSCAIRRRFVDTSTGS